MEAPEDEQTVSADVWENSRSAVCSHGPSFSVVDGGIMADFKRECKGEVPRVAPTGGGKEPGCAEPCRGPTTLVYEAIGQTQ